MVFAQMGRKGGPGGRRGGRQLRCYGESHGEPDGAGDMEEDEDGGGSGTDAETESATEAEAGTRTEAQSNKRVGARRCVSMREWGQHLAVACTRYVHSTSVCWTATCSCCSARSKYGTGRRQRLTWSRTQRRKRRRMQGWGRRWRRNALRDGGRDGDGDEDLRLRLRRGRGGGGRGCRE